MELEGGDGRREEKCNERLQKKGKEHKEQLTVVKLSAVRGGVRVVMLLLLLVILFRSTVHLPLLQVFTAFPAACTCRWVHSNGTGHWNVIVVVAHELTAVAVVQQTASLASRLSAQLPTGRLTVEPPLGSLSREGRLRFGVHLCAMIYKEKTS